MSETKNPGEKKLSVSGKTLTLKPRTETGVVRQSFSHGRSKQVVVEKVKRRVLGGPSEPKAEPAPAVEAKKPAAGRAKTASAGRPNLAPAETAPKPKPSGVVCVPLPTRSVTRAHTHSLIRGFATLKNARLPKKKLAAAPVASKSTAPSAKPRTRASAMRKSVASTTKRPSARLARSPRSASASMTLHVGQPRASRSKWMRTKRRAAGVVPGVRQPLHARRLALAPRSSADVLPSSMH